jgi:general secretion pathway protein K
MMLPPVRKQQGFVLILTLCILAAITIVAAYFGERVQKSLQLAQARQSLTDKQIALNNTRSEILFRMCTVRLTQYGLGQPPDAIALDDSPYANEETAVQLQDVHGLIPINFTNDAMLNGLLSVMQVPGDQHAHLIDTLRDYMDADDFRRLEGAESKEYAEQGLPPPRNMPLVSPMELKRIIGWRDSPTLWQDTPVTELVHTGPFGAINPNTAPWQVIASFPGVTPALAQAVVARRKLGPISLALLSQITGTNLDTFPPTATTFPASEVRVTQRAIGMPWAIRYNVRLTPSSTISPWQISYYYRIEEKAGSASANNVANGSEIPQLPARSALPATPTVNPIFGPG